MRILLYQTVRAETNRPGVGIGIPYLKSYLEEYCSFPVDIDLCYQEKGFRKLIAEKEYEIIGLSSVTYLFPKVESILKLIGDSPSASSALVVMGGAHITCLPESLPGGFRIGVIGEGEKTLLNICEIAGEKGATDLSDSDLGSIRGICFRNSKSELVVTDRADLIKDLNTIPSFDMSIFAANRSIPFIVSSRGCPYNCSFCSSVLVYERRARFHSSQYVYEQIKALKLLVPDIKVITFKDEIFNLSRRHFSGLAELVNKDPSLSEVRFVVSGHVKHIDEEMLEHCKKMNIYRISFGLESGSDRVLNALKRGAATIKDNQKALDLCYEFGVRCGANFIIGTPHEDRDDLTKTYDFIQRNLESGKLFTVGTSVLTPFPGTMYWELAKGKYSIDPLNFNWNRLDVNAFSTYWQDLDGSININDWWDYRNKKEALYIGSLPERDFLELITEPEYRMIRILGRNILEDRRPQGRKEDLLIIEDRLRLLESSSI